MQDQHNRYKQNTKNNEKDKKEDKDEIKEENKEENTVQIIDYKDRYDYLKQADVIVSATTSPHYTFTYYEVVQEIDNMECKILFLDLAVPCDIDKEISQIKGMEVLDIDYFEKASFDNNQRRQEESYKAEKMLDSRLDEIQKDIYFQEFQSNIHILENKIKEKGFPHILYQMKNSLRSEEIRIVLDSLKEIR